MGCLPFGDYDDYSPAFNSFAGHGGRQAAGFRRKAPGDCVTRSISIALELPYSEVHERVGEINQFVASARKLRIAPEKLAADYRGSVQCSRWLATMGWRFVAKQMPLTGALTILPAGHFIICFRTHWAAVIDGVLHDLHPEIGSGDVMGYFTKT
jgi:hypothetical protein